MNADRAAEPSTAQRTESETDLGPIEECQVERHSLTDLALQNDAERHAEPDAEFVLALGKSIDVHSLRHPREWLFLVPIVVTNLIVGLLLAMFAVNEPGAFAGLCVLAVAMYVAVRVSRTIMFWYLHGNSIQVTDRQYPELHNAVCEACRFLNIRKVPRVYIIHGGGLIELFIVKRFTKSGILVFTSEMFENLLQGGDSRPFMMVVGRQLGHIRAGHFRYWILTDMVGRLALPFYLAWSRACDYTADRIGMLVAGGLEPARNALVSLTVGRKLARAAHHESLLTQGQELRASPLALLAELLQSEPFIVRRVAELDSFQGQVERSWAPGGSGLVGFLPPEANRFDIKVEGHAIFGDGGEITIVRPMPASGPTL